MRLFVMSYGRARLQYTLATLSPNVLAQIELCVNKDEYTEYKNEWYGSKVKKIHCWPSHIDCAPKKRKAFCTKVAGNDDFLMLDDDLPMHVWDKKSARYVKADQLPKLTDKIFLDTIPEYFERYDHVALANKFMADYYVKEHGLEKTGGIGACVWGFKKGAASDIQFNRTFCYPDMYLPMQVLKKSGGNTMLYYGATWGSSSNAKLKTSGIHYRTQLLSVDTVIKLARYTPGVVTGYRMTAKDKSRFLMVKHPSRILSGVKEAHRQASKDFVRAELERQGLHSTPADYTFDDRTPREEIIRQIEENWLAAGGRLDLTLP